jgi:hypothetical protein
MGTDTLDLIPTHTHSHLNTASRGSPARPGWGRQERYVSRQDFQPNVARSSVSEALMFNNPFVPSSCRTFQAAPEAPAAGAGAARVAPAGEFGVGRPRGGGHGAGAPVRTAGTFRLGGGGGDAGGAIDRRWALDGGMAVGVFHSLTPTPWTHPPLAHPQTYNQYKAKKAAEAAAGGGSSSSGGGGGGMSALFAKRFYEGGFEEKMTRREAALILGVRCVFWCRTALNLNRSSECLIAHCSSRSTRWSRRSSVNRFRSIDAC